jgi:hypothetical protein
MSKNYRSASTKVTAKLSIYLEDPVSTITFRRELYKSYLLSRSEITKPLITGNNAKRRKTWCDDRKTWTLVILKYVIWSDESPFALFPTSGRVFVLKTSKEAYNLECLVQAVKHGARSVMIWVAISSILLVLYLL